MFSTSSSIATESVLGPEHIRKALRLATSIDLKSMEENALEAQRTFREKMGVLQGLGISLAMMRATLPKSRGKARSHHRAHEPQASNAVESNARTLAAHETTVKEPRSATRRGHAQVQSRRVQERVEDLFNRIAETKPGTLVPASDVYKAAEITRQAMHNHDNPECGVGESKEKLTIGHRDRSNGPKFYTRDSAMRWLAHRCFSMPEDELERRIAETSGHARQLG